MPQNCSLAMAQEQWVFFWPRVCLSEPFCEHLSFGTGSRCHLYTPTGLTKDLHLLLHLNLWSNLGRGGALVETTVEEF